METHRETFWRAVEMLKIGWSKLVDGIHRVCSKQVEKDAGDGAMKDE